MTDTEWTRKGEGDMRQQMRDKEEAEVAEH